MQTASQERAPLNPPRSAQASAKHVRPYRRPQRTVVPPFTNGTATNLIRVPSAKASITAMPTPCPHSPARAASPVACALRELTRVVAELRADRDALRVRLSACEREIAQLRRATSAGGAGREARVAAGGDREGGAGRGAGASSGTATAGEGGREVPINTPAAGVSPALRAATAKVRGDEVPILLMGGTHYGPAEVVVVEDDVYVREIDGLILCMSLACLVRDGCSEGELVMRAARRAEGFQVAALQLDDGGCVDVLAVADSELRKGGHGMADIAVENAQFQKLIQRVCDASGVGYGMLIGRDVVSYEGHRVVLKAKTDDFDFVFARRTEGRFRLRDRAEWLRRRGGSIAGIACLQFLVRVKDIDGPCLVLRLAGFVEAERRAGIDVDGTEETHSEGERLWKRKRKIS